MSDLLWLPGELRAAGLKVYEQAGWKTRQTRPGFKPVGVVCHHTATNKNVSDETMRRILVVGRADLKGPLAQCGLRRDGTWDIIASGRCNHNGFGQWGNDSIGVEAYNDGKGEPWPKAQLDSYTRGVAVICKHYGWGAHRVKGHKETDPERKIDPVGIDMAKFRRTVTALNKPPAPQSVEEIIAMSKDLLIKGSSTVNWWVSDGKTKRNLGTANITKQDEANQLCLIWGVVSAGVSGGNQQPIVVDQDLVNNIRTI